MTPDPPLPPPPATAATVRDRLAALLKDPLRIHAPDTLLAEVRCAQALLKAIELGDLEARLAELERRFPPLSHK
ncbi:MAG TPA: hypothetical protein VMV31_02420 [Terriglobales bacterium]|nr:hypothetical protein [Terriglobales bacterium]